MIVVQDNEKNYLGCYSTLKEFLKNYLGVEYVNEKYEYIRSRIAKSGGKTIKYKGFLITKDEVIRGRKSKFNPRLKGNRFFGR